MTNVAMKTQAVQHDGEAGVELFDDWFDPIETSLRERVRGFIEQVIEAELDGALGRPRYGRPAGSEPGGIGHRHGHRSRQLMGTFGSAAL